MIKISTPEVKIESVQPGKEEHKSKKGNLTFQSAEKPYSYQQRPEAVNARVYKCRSAFVNNSVFITLGYVQENGRKRPIEIFINSKDLSRAPEYVVLTRLISAIFRRADDPTFILEELRGIFDPNGGRHKEGKYIPSFYAEVADVIENFFLEVGIMKEANTQNGRISEINAEIISAIYLSGGTTRN